MGKIKLRKKYHLSPTESKSNTSNDNTSKVDTNLNNNINQDVKIPENLFSGLKFSIDDVNNVLNEEVDDTKSVKSTKNLYKNLNVSKVDKINLKRKMFLDMLQKQKLARVNEKKKKFREKTVITGDLNPLLESLDQIERSEKKTKPREPKKRGIMKAKNRQKNMFQDITFFQKVLVDPTYKKNPFECISTVVREKINRENQ